MKYELNFVCTVNLLPYLRAPSITVAYGSLTADVHSLTWLLRLISSKLEQKSQQNLVHALKYPVC